MLRLAWERTCYGFFPKASSTSRILPGSSDLRTIASANRTASSASLPLSDARTTTATLGRIRFASPAINAVSVPSSFKSRTTASIASPPNWISPSYPLPELSARQPFFLKYEQRKFKRTGSFPMQSTDFRRPLGTGLPLLFFGLAHFRPAPVHISPQATSISEFIAVCNDWNHAHPEFGPSVPKVSQ